MFPGTETGIGGGYAPTIAPKPTRHLTHEAFCHAVRRLAVDDHGIDLTPAEATRLMGAKLVYGVGDGGYHGICHFEAWSGSDAVIEIAATGERSTLQLAETVLHETAHVLAGLGAGHGKLWKQACARLGLIEASAVGCATTPEVFAPALWQDILKLGDPSDGAPTFKHFGRGKVDPDTGEVKPKPCPAGRGSRGGKRGGRGSGSRLRLWVCACVPAVKVRVARDAFEAKCNVCNTDFVRGGVVAPPPEA